MIGGIIFGEENLLAEEGVSELVEYLYKRYRLYVLGKGSRLVLPLQKVPNDVKNWILITRKPDLYPKIRALSFDQPKNILQKLKEIDPAIEFLSSNTFRCTKCGECCRPIVKVNKEDVALIEQAGYQREEFLDYDPMKENSQEKNTLKRNNGVCIFLKRQGEEFVCSIYDHRPKVCRTYPFYKNNLKPKDCVPTYIRKPKPLKEVME